MQAGHALLYYSWSSDSWDAVVGVMQPAVTVTAKINKRFTIRKMLIINRYIIIKFFIFNDI